MRTLVSKPMLRGMVLVLLVAGLASFTFSGGGGREYTLEFTEAKGIHVGDDVTVLGVPVGKVRKIEPKPDKVVMTVAVDDDTQIPADVRAAIVTKSIVSVRAVALAPAYTGGDTLPERATVPLSRTQVPVEWDTVKDEVVSLTQTLGPDGAGSDGALAELVTTSADFLGGQGKNFRATVDGLSQAAATLSDNRGDLFTSVKNLSVFAAALKENDGAVRRFERGLAAAGQTLTQDQDALAEALRSFESMSQKSRKFLAKNGKGLKKTLRSLEDTTSMLSDNRQTIADLLQVGPTAISNFYNIIDPRVSAITGALAIQNLNNPTYILCGALLTVGAEAVECANALEPIAKYLKLNAPPIGLNPLTGNGVGPDLVTTLDEANTLKRNNASSQKSSRTTTSETAPNVLRELTKVTP